MISTTHRGKISLPRGRHAAILAVTALVGGSLLATAPLLAASADADLFAKVSVDVSTDTSSTSTGAPVTLTVVASNTGTAPLARLGIALPAGASGVTCDQEVTVNGAQVSTTGPVAPGGTLSCTSTIVAAPTVTVYANGRIDGAAAPGGKDPLPARDVAQVEITEPVAEVTPEPAPQTAIPAVASPAAAVVEPPVAAADEEVEPPLSKISTVVTAPSTFTTGQPVPVSATITNIGAAGLHKYQLAYPLTITDLSCDQTVTITGPNNYGKNVATYTAPDDSDIGTLTCAGTYTPTEADIQAGTVTLTFNGYGFIFRSSIPGTKDPLVTEAKATLTFTAPPVTPTPAPTPVQTPTVAPASAPAAAPVSTPPTGGAALAETGGAVSPIAMGTAGALLAAGVIASVIARRRAHTLHHQPVKVD